MGQNGSINNISYFKFQVDNNLVIKRINKSNGSRKSVVMYRVLHVQFRTSYHLVAVLSRQPYSWFFPDLCMYAAVRGLQSSDVQMTMGARGGQGVWGRVPQRGPGMEPR